MTFLPGTNKQIEILLNSLAGELTSILIIGAGCEEISKMMAAKYSCGVVIIVEDNESLLTSRLKLSGQEKIKVRMMDYSNTDFRDSSFDLVYAQASISGNRNNITKEVKRIIKPEGYFCNGEVVSIKDSIPAFVEDIWKASGISPLRSNEFAEYFRTKGFDIIGETDLSDSLKEFYSTGIRLLKEKSSGFSEQEKSYYKKLLKQISHESNAYLKLGGSKYIGFKMLITKKESV